MLLLLFIGLAAAQPFVQTAVSEVSSGVLVQITVLDSTELTIKDVNGTLSHVLLLVNETVALEVKHIGMFATDWTTTDNGIQFIIPNHALWASGLCRVHAPIILSDGTLLANNEVTTTFICRRQSPSAAGFWVAVVFVPFFLVLVCALIIWAIYADDDNSKSARGARATL